MHDFRWLRKVYRFCCTWQFPLYGFNGIHCTIFLTNLFCRWGKNIVHTIYFIFPLTRKLCKPKIIKSDVQYLSVLSYISITIHDIHSDLEPTTNVRITINETWTHCKWVNYCMTEYRKSHCIWYSEKSAQMHTILDLYKGRPCFCIIFV